MTDDMNDLIKLITRFKKNKKYLQVGKQTKQVNLSRVNFGVVTVLIGWQECAADGFF